MKTRCVARVERLVRAQVALSKSQRCSGPGAHSQNYPPARSSELSLRLFLITASHTLTSQREMLPCSCSVQVSISRMFRPTAELPLWLSPCLHFSVELFTWDLHAHKALACHGHRLNISYSMSLSPEMVENEGFISKGIG